jgi:hypothetical protein
MTCARGAGSGDAVIAEQLPAYWFQNIKGLARPRGAILFLFFALCCLL